MRSNPIRSLRRGESVYVCDEIDGGYSHLPPKRLIVDEDWDGSAADAICVVDPNATASTPGEFTLKFANAAYLHKTCLQAWIARIYGMIEAGTAPDRILESIDRMALHAQSELRDPDITALRAANADSRASLERE